MLSRHHHVLQNGLRIVTTPQPHLHGVCVALAIGCGARHDTPRKWGLAHFVEHMMFRGSHSYPDAAALIAPFERGGGTLNAETWRDHTMFWCVVHPKHLAATLAAMGDMMCRPRFDDIELERSLVHAELAADVDEDGQDTDLGAFSRKNIWANHPMGRRIVGSEDSLDGLTKQDVRRLHRRAYVASNMALAVVGRVTPGAIERLAQQHFGPLPQGSPLLQGRPPTFTPKRLGPTPSPDVLPHPVRESTLQLTFEALPDGHPDFAALSLLVSLLDDGMGTRLHRALSERTGLVYAFETGLDCYRDCGLYDLELQVAPERLQAALAVAVGVLLDVARADVSHKELQAAKERALLAVELGQDSAEEMAQEAAVDLLFGRPGPKRYQQAIERTTVDDITRLAQKIFLQAPRRMTLMGATAGVNGAELGQIVDRLSPKKASPAPLALAVKPTRQRSSYRRAATARRNRAGQYTPVMPPQ